jgi:hypothetical protein
MGAGFPAAASQLASEGFNYPVGSSLAGQNGGSGWSSSWNNSQTELGVNIVPGLTYQNLLTSPGAAQSDLASGNATVAFFTRQLGFTYGAPNTTLYVSFLLQPETGFGFYGGLNLDGIFVGKSGPTNTYGIEGPTNDISSSSVTAVAGTTVFLVLEANFLASGDEFSLYVDPTPGAAQPTVADAFKNDYQLPESNYIFLNNAGGWTVSNILFGTTYQSVTPAAASSIPEPSYSWFIAVMIGASAALRIRKGSPRKA